MPVCQVSMFSVLFTFLSSGTGEKQLDIFPTVLVVI